MKPEPTTDQKRQAGTQCVETRAVAIAKTHDIAISSCVWDIGEDLASTYAHRLDLFAGTEVVRLYFSDLELIGQDNPGRMERLAFRLDRAIAQLMAKPHSPTYSLI
jgi:hypothetical protein